MAESSRTPAKKAAAPAAAKKTAAPAEKKTVEGKPATKPEHQGKPAEGEVSPPPPTTSAPTFGDGAPAQVPKTPDAPSVHPQTTEGVTRKEAKAAASDPQGQARVERDTGAAEERRDGRPIPVDVDIAQRAAAAPLEAPETRPGVRTEKREEMPSTEAVDTTAAAAGLMSLSGQTSGGLYGEDGKKITSASGLFEDIGDGTTSRTTKRIEEEFTPRNAITPTRRLIYAEGQTVSRADAARFTRFLDN